MINKDNGKIYVMILTDEKKYKLLIEISHKVRDTLDLDEIMEHLLDTIKTMVDYDAAGIFVLNQDLVHGRREHPKEIIAGIARRGFDTKPVEEDAMYTSGKGIIGHVIFSGSSLILPDVRLDSRYIEGRSLTQSEITVPIIRNDRAIGALNLESDRLSVYDETDLEVLQFFADAAAISIEKAMLHRQLLEKKLIDKQLELARDMQSRLFPNEPPDITGYDIAGICLPTEEIGGDYYDFIQLPHGGIGVAVGDVSGNGIASALVMTAFRGLLRMHTHGRLGPAKIARAINRLLPEFTGDSHFITAVYIVLNLDADDFTYVSCGHQPPLLLRSDGSIVNLTVHGPALGIFNTVNYRTEKISVNSGDILMLYTDGVIEVTNPDGVEFGIERLKTVLVQGRSLPAAELIQMIIQTTQQFSCSQSYMDDFTLVIIKRE
jgi:sigma-B regulation protein RsbU (phosphoserine phosphatase)